MQDTLGQTKSALLVKPQVLASVRFVSAVYLMIDRNLIIRRSSPRILAWSYVTFSSAAEH